MIFIFCRAEERVKLDNCYYFLVFHGPKEIVLSKTIKSRHRGIHITLKILKAALEAREKS